MLAACTGAPEDSGATPAEAPDAPISSASKAPQPTITDRPALASPVDPARPEGCNAPKADAFVGRRAGSTIRAELAAAVAPIRAIRWVGPGDATTEDYSPQRLNVMLDVGDKIVSVHCG